LARFATWVLTWIGPGFTWFAEIRPGLAALVGFAFRGTGLSMGAGRGEAAGALQIPLLFLLFEFFLPQFPAFPFGEAAGLAIGSQLCILGGGSLTLIGRTLRGITRGRWAIGRVPGRIGPWLAGWIG